MERWRSFFDTAKADIWTVIHHAITVAATDYPKDFRDRRDQIAETLFDRRLLQQQHVEDDPGLICEDGVRGTSLSHMLKAPINAGDVSECGRLSHMLKAPINAGDVSECGRLHDDAEALSDELEEEALILRDLHCIKTTLADVDQPENVILEALQRLQYMQITVDNLKATEIGKHVRSLKKHSSQRVKAIAKELMRQWKVLIDEWISSVEDVTTTVTTADPRTDCGDCLEDGKHGVGLLAPPLDECALLETGATDMDLSQLFNFVDGEDLCTGRPGSQIALNSVEPTVKDNLSYLCRSQSGSILTECSELDTKASTGHSWGLTMPEERGSATRDVYPPSGKIEREKLDTKRQVSHRDNKRQVSHRGKTRIEGGLQLSKTIANGSGPGRPCNEISTAKPVLGQVRAKAFIDGSSMSHIDVLQNRPSISASNLDRLCAKAKPTTDSSSLDRSNVCNVDKQSGTNQIDQKLELAKRKLHQGYQQAENAKKQRTVQILNSSDLPLSTQEAKAKINTHVHNGHGGRANMNARVQNKEVMGAKLNVPVHKKACIQSGRQCSQNRKFS